jgi:hypothetical protein
MTELFKVFAIVAPAFFVGMIGVFCGGRFVDRKFRAPQAAVDPSKPIVIRLDRASVKVKQAA